MEAFNFSKGLTVLSQTPMVCDKHGPYTEIQYKQFTKGCPVCAEIDLKKREEESRIEGERKRREQHKNWLLQMASIPPRFADRHLNNFRVGNDGQRKALAISQAYVDGFSRESGQSLILCGSVGAGKTHLAVGIVQGLMEKGVVCVFASVIGAIRSIKDTYRRDSEISERQALEKLIEPDLLVLDEVGVQFGSEAEKMILFEIINGRYENMKSTIVISNLAIGALDDFLGERVVDRMREGGGKVVIFDWDSYRRQAA